MPAFVSGKNLNSKIQVAGIGVGGKGRSDTMNAAKCGGEIVGLCDIDGGKLDEMAKRYSKAAKFSDFREMLTKIGDKVDAVTISTPDHLHGVAGIMAMQMGKNVYCQKPLTQTVWESRMMRNLSRDKKLATQMGNQGSAGDGLRRSVELIQAGVIGNPKELHVWTNRPVWPQGLERPAGADPIPDNLNWDCFIGPAQMRPYKQGVYHDFKWRGWSDFGICDHSQSLRIASGMSVETLMRQKAEIAALNAEFEGDSGSPFRVFFGVESDILGDGSLDYPDEVLAEFDMIVASIHVRFNMTETEATDRIIRAVANPYTTILGHPTGRLILKRAGYPLDHEAVLQACALHGVAIELNASPYRLDLDWRWIERAVELNVPVAINPDAHSIEQLDLMKWGVVAARKGGLTARHCLNALSLSDFKSFLHAKKIASGIV